MSHLAYAQEQEARSATAIAWDRLSPAQEVALARRLLDAHANQELERFFFLLPLAAKLALPALKGIAGAALKGAGKMALKGLAKSAIKGLGKSALKNLGKTAFRKFGRQALQRVGRQALQQARGMGRQALQRARQEALSRARRAAQDLQRRTIERARQQALARARMAAQQMRQRAVETGRQAIQQARQQVPSMVTDAIGDPNVDQQPPEGIEPPVPPDSDPADADDDGGGDEEFSLRVARQLVRTAADTARRLGAMPHAAQSPGAASRAVLDALRANAPDVRRILRALPT